MKKFKGVENKPFEDMILDGLEDEKEKEFESEGIEAVKKDISKSLVRFIIKNGINALFRDVHVALNNILLHKIPYDFKFEDHQKEFKNLGLAEKLLGKMWNTWITNRIRINESKKAIEIGYKYGLRGKPYTINTAPLKPIKVVDPEEPGAFHDILIYNRVLAPQEIEKYDLVDLNEQTEEYKTLGKEMGDYFNCLLQHKNMDDVSLRSVFEEK